MSLEAVRSAAAGIALIGIATIAAADTPVGGVISTNTTWTLAASPYLVTSAITVNQNVTLTIEPGVLVKVNPNLRILVKGTLLAQGSASQRIRFTSSQTSPLPGDWTAIAFDPGPGPTASRLTHVDVQFSGRNTSEDGSIYVNDSSPQFNDLSIANSATNGVRVIGANATPVIRNSSISGSGWAGARVENLAGLVVSGTQISDSGGYAMQAWPRTRIVDLVGMVLTGNNGGGGNAIQMAGGTTAGSTNWPAGAEWHVASNFTVSAGSTLTIAPGTRVRVAGSTWIDVSGTLAALGLPSTPIEFTSLQESPAPGGWVGIRFKAGSSESQITHAHVLYAGHNQDWAGRASIQITDANPTLDHVHVAHSASNGIRVIHPPSPPVLSNLTISECSNAGILLNADSSLTLRDSTISGNAGYAIEAGKNSHLLELTGLTMEGNGGGEKDGIWYRGNGFNGTHTWLRGAEWHLDNAVSVAVGSTLTIESGATVKLAGTGTYIDVHGTLVADGTAQARVVFTSRSSNPAAGNWASIIFETTSGSTSRLSYTDVRFGGRNQNYSGNTAIWVKDCSPTLDHVAVRHSASHGIRIQGDTPLRIFGAEFEDILFRGVENGTNPVTRVDARLSYWADPTGPSAPGGPGSGIPVSLHVDFDPWLIGPPSHPNEFTDATSRNRVFNPLIEVPHVLEFESAMPGNWTARYRNPLGELVRTMSGTGSSGSTVWDGRDEDGVLQADGTYSYELSTTAILGSLGSQATPARGVAILDSLRSLVISGTGISQAYFSPNGDGIQDTTAYSGAFNFDTVDWTVRVVDGGGGIVQVDEGIGSSFSYVWDGTGGNVADGPHVMEVTATIGIDEATAFGQTVRDTVPPETVILQPADGALLSNVRQGGVDDVQIVGTASDLNLQSWSLGFRPAGSGSWTTLASGSTSVVSSLLKVWSTLERTNGEYELRILSADKAGNSSQSIRGVSIGNFQVSQSVLEFNVGAGESVSYSSTVPFALVEKLTIRDLSGNVVTTLTDGQREAGVHVDEWSGLTDSGSQLTDGGYLYIAEVWDDPYYMEWDLTDEFLGTWWQHNNSMNIQPFDPFDNRPMTFSYDYSQPGRVSIGFGPNTTVQAHCNPPNFCLMHEQYQDSRPRTIQWAGVDDTGALRPDLRGVGAMTRHHEFSKNAVVLYGRAPTVMNVHAVPPIFSPATGPEKITFDLTTYAVEPVDVTVVFRNQDSLSDLRTIVAPGTLAGPVSIEWDGRADNGMLVAPGRYTITVTATDSRGNVARGQILARVQY